MNKYLIICIAAVCGGLLVWAGIRNGKIKTALLGIGTFFAGIFAFLWKENKELKEKSKEQELQARKQKDVIKAYSTAVKTEQEIQQKTKADNTAVSKAVKEAQNSENPVKAHIMVGNDIADRFNNK